MSTQSLLEKLQIGSEKNILIQGLPSSVEKHFSKINYSKNLTPLLKIRKIDFALVFALSNSQLCRILQDVFPALSINAKLWIAYPKPASKIASDLHKDCSWQILKDNAFEISEDIEMDTVWSAMHFTRVNNADATEIMKDAKKSSDNVYQSSKTNKFEKKLSIVPVELSTLFNKQLKAKEFFFSLSPSHQKQYVTWITGAKRADVRERRLEATVEKLLAGKKSPLEK